MAGSIEVLVLDDEDVVCERLKSSLEKREFSVETFTESQKAIDRLSDKRFDVVVTDVKMKGPSGLEVLHFIKRQDPDTQVIIVTGYGSLENVREAEYGGAFECINKPFTASDMEHLVRRAARKSRRPGGKTKR